MGRKNLKEKIKMVLDYVRAKKMLAKQRLCPIIFFKENII